MKKRYIIGIGVGIIALVLLVLWYSFFQHKTKPAPQEPRENVEIAEKAPQKEKKKEREFRYEDFIPLLRKEIQNDIDEHNKITNINNYMDLLKLPKEELSKHKDLEKLYNILKKSAEKGVVEKNHKIIKAKLEEKVLKLDIRVSSVYNSTRGEIEYSMSDGKKTYKFEDLVGILENFVLFENRGVDENVIHLEYEIDGEFLPTKLHIHYKGDDFSDNSQYYDISLPKNKGKR